jgi:hypothetical protein
VAIVDEMYAEMQTAVEAAEVVEVDGEVVAKRHDAQPCSRCRREDLYPDVARVRELGTRSAAWPLAFLAARPR